MLLLVCVALPFFQKGLRTHTHRQTNTQNHTHTKQTNKNTIMLISCEGGVTAQRMHIIIWGNITFFKKKNFTHSFTHTLKSVWNSFYLNHSVTKRFVGVARAHSLSVHFAFVGFTLWNFKHTQFPQTNTTHATSQYFLLALTLSIRVTDNKKRTLLLLFFIAFALFVIFCCCCFSCIKNKPKSTKQQLHKHLTIHT